MSLACCWLDWIWCVLYSVVSCIVSTLCARLGVLECDTSGSSHLLACNLIKTLELLRSLRAIFSDHSERFEKPCNVTFHAYHFTFSGRGEMTTKRSGHKKHMMGFSRMMHARSAWSGPCVWSDLSYSKSLKSCFRTPGPICKQGLLTAWWLATRQNSARHFYRTSYSYTLWLNVDLCSNYYRQNEGNTKIILSQCLPSFGGMRLLIGVTPTTGVVVQGVPQAVYGDKYLNNTHCSLRFYRASAYCCWRAILI